MARQIDRCVLNPKLARPTPKKDASAIHLTFRSPGAACNRTDDYSSSLSACISAGKTGIGQRRGRRHPTLDILNSKEA